MARLAGSDGSAGICVADADLIRFHGRSLSKQGLKPYDPAGKPLAAFECATLARLWLSFCSTGRLADLRGLAEHPVFLRTLCRESQLSPSVALAALDELRSEYLLETLQDAVLYFNEHTSAGTRLAQAAGLIAAAKRLSHGAGVSKSLKELSAFLRFVYAEQQVDSASTEAEALASLANLLEAITGSPLSAPEFDEAVFCEEMKHAPVFESHAGNEMELNGWLEAPWLPHSRIVLSGCTEGALPARVVSHPFLPDSLRRALGLHSNLQRFTRDTYFLHCLLATRAPGELKVTLSRTQIDGEPAKPSRLLFRCPDVELTARVRNLFGAGVSMRITHARERTWLLDVPKRPALATLRATAFRDYLHCPLRFYFKHVLQMREFESQKAEMHALDFGTILHQVVERFAKETRVRDSRNVAAIEKFVLRELDSQFFERFGRQLSLPVRVQRESLRARLRQFSRIQAEERRAGWRIQSGEVRFEKEATLSLAGLSILASLDRLDIHEKTGQRRILDYKTSAKRRTAFEAHLEAATGEDILLETFFEGKMFRWRDLQLPLYRALAHFQWPDDPAPCAVAYFLLPERVEESGIDEFHIDGPTFQSALNSARVIADRVRRGIYWPPRSVTHDDYRSIFLGEDAASALSARSREFLVGLQEASEESHMAAPRRNTPANSENKLLQGKFAF